MAKRITISIDNETFAALEARADEMGLVNKAPLVRMCVRKEFGGKDAPLRTVSVPADVYLQFLSYVKGKRLGSVDVFATFAMEQYMTRYPLKTASKKQDGESIGD
jgi:hypothetical protein